MSSEWDWIMDELRRIKNDAENLWTHISNLEEDIISALSKDPSSERR
jgi:hypothetical protein